MNKTLQKLSLQNAKKIAYSFYAVSIMIHVLVITKVIPYTLVNGGRSESYDAQLQTSKANIIALLVMPPALWLVLERPKFQPYARKPAMYVVVFFLGLGFVMQLLGTWFEKLVIAPIMLVGLIAMLRLLKSIDAVDYGSSTKSSNTEK